jgi:hypothetical protein
VRGQGEHEEGEGSGEKILWPSRVLFRPHLGLSSCHVTLMAQLAGIQLACAIILLN